MFSKFSASGRLTIIIDMTALLEYFDLEGVILASLLANTSWQPPKSFFVGFHYVLSNVK